MWIGTDQEDHPPDMRLCMRESVRLQIQAPTVSAFNAQTTETSTVRVVLDIASSASNAAFQVLEIWPRRNSYFLESH
ncbi:hypothetical protein VTO42DRAFT_7612 [Malbranchea cinnamomea]